MHFVRAYIEQVTFVRGDGGEPVMVISDVEWEKMGKPRTIRVSISPMEE